MTSAWYSFLQCRIAVESGRSDVSTIHPFFLDEDCFQLLIGNFAIRVGMTAHFTIVMAARYNVVQFSVPQDRADSDSAHTVHRIPTQTGVLSVHDGVCGRRDGVGCVKMLRVDQGAITPPPPYRLVTYTKMPITRVGMLNFKLSPWFIVYKLSSFG